MSLSLYLFCKGSNSLLLVDLTQLYESAVLESDYSHLPLLCMIHLQLPHNSQLNLNKLQEMPLTYGVCATSSIVPVELII